MKLESVRTHVVYRVLRLRMCLELDAWKGRGFFEPLVKQFSWQGQDLEVPTDSLSRFYVGRGAFCFLRLKVFFRFFVSTFDFPQVTMRPSTFLEEHTKNKEASPRALPKKQVLCPKLCSEVIELRRNLILGHEQMKIFCCCMCAAGCSAGLASQKQQVRGT